MNADPTQVILNAMTSKVIECAYRVSNTLGAGFLIGSSVVVEIKALDMLTRAHHAPCMNYLRATRLSLGLFLNFGAPRLEVKRVVWRF